MLNSVGPENMSEDEHVIGDGYQLGINSLLGSIPFAVAYFFDTKWVVASGLAIVLVMLNEVGGRLHELCIRLRRTNILINSQIIDKSSD
jgi:uncharacterized membrane protein